MTIIRGAGSPDHIHMLVAAPPQISPAKLVQFIKGRSSRRLQHEFPALRKRYWGQHLWARGYFCASGGAVDEAKRNAYVSNIENLLARSLHSLAYQNHPSFGSLLERTGLPFRHYDAFGPEAQAER